MNGASLLAVLLCGLSFIYSTALTGSTPRYTVDLDLNPQDRWKQVGLDYAPILKVVKQEILKHYHISKELLEIADKIGSNLNKYIPDPFSGELLGLANSSQIPIPELVLINLLYEITAFCTSIVAENNTGQILHGRNLDYYIVPDLSSVVIDVDFKRSGKTVYTGTTFAGYVGLLTSQKPGVLTVTINERNKGNLLENLLDLLLSNYSMVSFAVREMLDGPIQSFSSAVVHLAYQVKLVSPCYIIVGGVSTLEGVVITRNRVSALDIRQLDLVSGEWFVIETNYDGWNTPPPSDDRRDPAIGMLDKLGREITLDTLYGVLSREPVCNSGTIYTTVMSAADPTAYSTHVRNNDCS